MGEFEFCFAIFMGIFGLVSIITIICGTIENVSKNKSEVNKNERDG